MDFPMVVGATCCSKDVMSAVQALLKILVDKKILSEFPSSVVLSKRGEGTLRALGILGLLNEQSAIATVATTLKIPVLSLEKLRTSPLPLEARGKIDPQALLSAKIIPYELAPGKYGLACANPLDHEAARAFQFNTGLATSVAIAAESDILQSISEHYLGKTVKEELESLSSLDEVEVSTRPNSSETDLSIPETEQPPIIRIANRIISEAVRENASDVHLEPHESGLTVRFRIDGVMHTIFEIPKKQAAAVTSRIKILSSMDIAERRKAQDGRLCVQVTGEVIDLRVSSLPSHQGEKVVMRLLRGTTAQLTIDKMGMPPRTEVALRRALTTTGKMLLVTGPTGSGKTTSLYAFIHYLKDGTSNITTVEDPIEYIISGVNQTQVNPAANLTFAAALRSILRQDPDTIMIGEIRDQETTSIALQAAQTGHLVLSTLHTNDAPSVISRLFALGADPEQVGSSLIGVLAQRLVRKSCPSCAAAPHSSYLDKYGEWIKASSISPESLVVGKGCPECRTTGYKGRLGVYSYLEITPAIAAGIRNRLSPHELGQIAKREGFLSLSDVGLSLVKEGKTTFDEIAGFLDMPEEVAPQCMASSPGVEKQTILLVEDDPDVRAVISMVLEKEMYEVIQAENGQEALTKVYERKPSLILSDLMMPVMDGRELLKKLRGNKATAAIPVLILTAVDSEENEVGLLDLGARDFVSKASSATVMLSRIRNHLG